jgi:hypothetical protein
MRREVAPGQRRNGMVVAKGPFGIGQRGPEQCDAFMCLTVVKVRGREVAVSKRGIASCTPIPST